MNRQQLEHIIRAAAAITGADQLVIIGSQAILGQFPDPPPETTVSIEVDVFSLRSPEDAELIDGSIGEASPFHRTFGYYAHGVGEDTAILPAGWKDRLVGFGPIPPAGQRGSAWNSTTWRPRSSLPVGRRISSMSPRSCVTALRV